MFTPGIKLFQAAWIVDDIDAAMHEWTRIHGVGPFFVARNVPPAKNARYRGQPTYYSHSGAMAQAGDIQIELVQQHGEGPPLYNDKALIASKGLHHLGSITENLTATVEHYKQQGFEPFLEGSFGELQYAFMDTRAARGYLTEIVEDCSLARKILALTREASKDWNGDDPIRNLGDYL